MEMPEFTKKIRKSLNYYINRDGFVSRKLNGNFFEVKKHLHNGYHRVSIKYRTGNKIELVQRLMLKTFVRDPSKTIREEAAHLNGIRTDNILSNLKWCTCKENNSHKKIHGTYLDGSKVPTSKLNASDVYEIKRLAKIGFYQRELARVFKISQPNIGRIIKGTRWVNAAS